MVALGVGAFLLPWCAVLAVTLPLRRPRSTGGWPWVGLDGGEAVAALATAVLLTRFDIRASLTAVAGAALLLCDAWFDVCTSARGLDQVIAVAEAGLAEIPLATAAVWLAIRLLRRHGKTRFMP